MGRSSWSAEGSKFRSDDLMGFVLGGFFLGHEKTRSHVDMVFWWSLGVQNSEKAVAWECFGVALRKFQIRKRLSHGKILRRVLERLKNFTCCCHGGVSARKVLVCKTQRASYMWMEVAAGN